MLTSLAQSSWLRRIPRGLSRRAQRVEAKLSTWWFDRRFGMDTATILDRKDLDVARDIRELAWSYEPCSPARFRRVMRKVPLAPRNATFVDIGSGRGQLLVLAQLMGFGRVIGVEFSPALHAAAQRNVQAARRNGRTGGIELLNMDATNFELPAEDCVLFMFNPFHEPLVRKFLAGLQRQLRMRRRALYIAYVHPTAAAVFDDSSLFERHAECGGATDAVIYRFLPG